MRRHKKQKFCFLFFFTYIIFSTSFQSFCCHCFSLSHSYYSFTSFPPQLLSPFSSKLVSFYLLLLLSLSSSSSLFIFFFFSLYLLLLLIHFLFFLLPFLFLCFFSSQSFFSYTLFLSFSLPILFCFFSVFNRAVVQPGS